jgi:hypothetical protein
MSLGMETDLKQASQERASVASPGDTNVVIGGGVGRAMPLKNLMTTGRPKYGVGRHCLSNHLEPKDMNLNLKDRCLSRRLLLNTLTLLE